MKLTYILILILLLLAAGIYIFTIIQPGPVATLESTKTDSQNQESDTTIQGQAINNPPNTQNNEINSNQNPTTQISPEANGAGGGGSSSSSAQSETTTDNPPSGSCFYEQISYALKNLNETQTCISYQNEVCIKKIVYCSIDVYNLDSQLSDLFEIEFSFLDQSSILQTYKDSNIVSPTQYLKFESSITLEDENANKNIDCIYRTTKIPKKEIC
jgi:hypothetical protein